MSHLLHTFVKDVQYNVSSSSIRPQNRCPEVCRHRTTDSGPAVEYGPTQVQAGTLGYRAVQHTPALAIPSDGRRFPLPPGMLGNEIIVDLQQLLCLQTDTLQCPL